MLISTHTANAQSGAIACLVTDKKQEPLINVSVIVKQKSQVIYKGVTDYDGMFQIKGLYTGLYDLEFRYEGCSVSIVHDVAVSDERTTTVNNVLELVKPSEALKYRREGDTQKIQFFEVRETYYIKPVIEDNGMDGRTVFSAADIEKIPLSQCSVNIARFAGANNSGRGQYFNKRYGGAENSEYNRRTNFLNRRSRFRHPGKSHHKGVRRANTATRSIRHGATRHRTMK